MNTYTDTDIVDAVALGLGTKPEWSYEDLEWIGEVIALAGNTPATKDAWPTTKRSNGPKAKTPNVTVSCTSSWDCPDLT